MNEEKFDKRARVVGVISSIVLWMVVLVPAVVEHGKTPPDALKPIGYFFIALYGGFVAAAGGLAAYFFALAFKYRSSLAKVSLNTLLGVVFAVISNSLFVWIFVRGMK